MEYAVVKTGGKQYKVSPGDILDVDRINEISEGENVTLDNVLLMCDSKGQLTYGDPVIKGAKVTGIIEKHLRGDKIIVFRFKNKTRAGTKTGHRQELTRIKIDKLTKRQTKTQKPKSEEVVSEETVEAPSKPRTQKAKPKTESISEN